MPSFTDTTGREWKVAITVADVRRVKETLDVNLVHAIGGTLLQDLSEDPLLLCDVLYVVCQQQAEERQVSDADFGRGLAGDVITDATSAFLQALVDFFPSGKSQMLRRVLAKWEAVQARGLSHAQQILDSPQLEAKIDSILNKATDSCLNLEEKSE